MQSASGVPPKLLIRWSPAAIKSYYASLAHIEMQDDHTAKLIAQRVNRALDILSSQPGLGTPVPRSFSRRFAIPNTGHMIEYRVRGIELWISRWMRQTRRRKPSLP
ncbi:type II toxin-antitoxin system RelE/ParE family toxin [Oxalobacteraceae bacterium]|nr:type II toxin-antitoxin system RelE/ParE family toxin [Oxalobacteraceae bacterium]